MAKLRWRLFLHFLIQFILVAASMLLLIIATAIIAVMFFTRGQFEHNYYQTMLDSVAMDTGNSITEIEMAEGWEDRVIENNVWVQIIDEDGKVIDSANQPDTLPMSYNPYELMVLQESKKLQEYSIVYYLETFYESNYLFLLGYKDRGNQLLQEIVSNYSSEQVLSDTGLTDLEQLLQKNEGTLEIYGPDNTLLLAAGEDREDEKVLDVFLRKISPDVFSTKQSTYIDPNTDELWVLYTPNQNKTDIDLGNIRDIMIAFAITASIVLLVTILVAIWNGFRYGNPLFIFTNWLSRMGNEDYEVVLTSQEKKQVFKRNGKLKRRYRLYKEVFHAFYEMAEKLDISQKERKRLEKTREEWMAGISHDLRTPLTTIQGYGNLLENGSYDWTKQELIEIGKTIDNKSNYMLRLIEDFTLSFQLKNDVADIIFERIEINAYMDIMMKRYEMDLTIEGYSIHYKQPENGINLEINKRLFERMLDNLIYNAINHNPIGTKIEVTAEKVKEKDQVKIMIKDNGVGMSENTLNHLFDRYYRGTNTEERIEGTGLGMSIALQIAKAHGGTIHVDSKENKGTTAIIILPISKE
ncbi:sensor histidine kinase [Ornithinibacillus scapharcae]|uniref:sensor histidine kinase n=1 Tax=Ornithinibacillus scapharcae TaxID=1147159 RepID=UPI000225AD79|nr:HAMP domain-containing sensor histidine kinase [Ornithinibacillus scapharcae]